MTILHMNLSQVAADFGRPFTANRGISAICETHEATIRLAAQIAGIKSEARRIIEENAVISLDPAPKIRSALDGKIASAMPRALDLIETSCSAMVLEKMPNTALGRKNLIRINQALAADDFSCSFGFGGRKFTIGNLGLAARAGTDVPWYGEIVFFPTIWNDGFRLVSGESKDRNYVILNLSHDAALYEQLFSKRPKAIRFQARGHKNKRQLRVIPDSKLEPVSLEELGQLALERT